MTSNSLKNTVYLLNKPGVSESFYYDLTWRNDISRPYVTLREAIEKEGFQFKVVMDASHLKDAAAIISFCYWDDRMLKNLARQPKKRCFLIVPEPPSILPIMYVKKLKLFFGTIFVLLDDYVDNQTYFKFHHPHYRVSPLDDIPDFSQKKLGVMMHSNLHANHPNDLYAERHRLATDFSNPDEFDLYGNGWETYPTWKGEAGDDKLNYLKNYKFYFAYENTRDMLGYVTERIIDAFFGGCVPIYWGASNITDYVPKECFVDRRDFVSNQDLYRYMKSVDRTRYEVYLAAGREFLKSPAAEIFSPAHFAQTIVRRLSQAIQSSAR